MKLSALIAHARVDHPCSQGHDWQSDGARACPNDPDCGGFQAVYRCTRCDDWDYGELGGPGHDDCVRSCNLGGRAYERS